MKTGTEMCYKLPAKNVKSNSETYLLYIFTGNKHSAGPHTCSKTQYNSWFDWLIFV